MAEPVVTRADTHEQIIHLLCRTRHEMMRTRVPREKYYYLAAEILNGFETYNAEPGPEGPLQLNDYAVRIIDYRFGPKNPKVA